MVLLGNRPNQIYCIFLLHALKSRQEFFKLIIKHCCFNYKWPKINTITFNFICTSILVEIFTRGIFHKSVDHKIKYPLKTLIKTTKHVIEKFYLVKDPKIASIHTVLRLYTYVNLACISFQCDMNFHWKIR